MSSLIDLTALAGAISCAWVIASHLVRMARKGRPWILEGRSLTLPLYGCGLVGCLTAAGAVGLAPGILLALLLFAVAAVPLAAAWARAAGKGQGGKVAGRIAAGLLSQARGGAAYIAGDARAVAGLLRPLPATGGGAPAAAGPVPVKASPGVPPWRRTVPGVPSITADPSLGPVPPPSEVSAALAASGVMVPAAWAAVASEAAEHEPESDEEHCEHMDGEVAGILTWAEAVMARAESLGDGAGLDPAYVAAQYEFADDVAELAAHAAQVMRRYHDIYDDIREAAAGRPLPANRHWFADGEPAAPQGGQAA